MKFIVWKETEREDSGNWGRTVIEGKSGQIKFEMPKSIEISISKKVLGQIPCTRAHTHTHMRLSIK